MKVKKMQLDIKPFKQSYGYCGPASLKILLSHYGVKKSEKSLAKLINSSRENGCTAKAIVGAARKLGFQAYFSDKNSLRDLETLLKTGIPPMVNWFLELEEDDKDGHYSIVKGITSRKITLADPMIGDFREMERRDFYKKWYDFYGKYLRSDKSNLIKRRIIAIYPISD